MTERWTPIHDQPGYEVSDAGRVRSLDRVVPYKDGRRANFRGKVLTGSRGASGYVQVAMSRQAGGRVALVHRLVAEAFLPRIAGRDFVNHMNGDKRDNSAVNLEWVSMAENNRHARESGLHSQFGESTNLSRYSAQLVAAMLRVRARYQPTNRELADLFDISFQQVGGIINGKTRRQG